MLGVDGNGSGSLRPHWTWSLHLSDVMLLATAAIIFAITRNNAFTELLLSPVLLKRAFFKYVPPRSMWWPRTNRKSSVLEHIPNYFKLVPRRASPSPSETRFLSGKSNSLDSSIARARYLSIRYCLRVLMVLTSFPCRNGGDPGTLIVKEREETTKPQKDCSNK
jgi:hypothetical protein